MRKAISAVCLFLLLGLVLAACGGSSANNGNQGALSSNSNQGNAGPTAVKGPPQSGGRRSVRSDG